MLVIVYWLKAMPLLGIVTSVAVIVNVELAPALCEKLNRINGTEKSKRQRNLDRVVIISTSLAA